MIPVMLPRLPSAGDVHPYLERIDSTRIYTNFGPLVREFEQRHAQRLGVDPSTVVSVANATLGLEGAVAVSGATTWIVPDYTFPASVHAVLAAGKSLQLSDIDGVDWQLDTSALKGGDDVGIMPVLPFGAGISLARWAGFDEVVIDAAASLGSDELDLAGLPETWAVVFSVHATKVLPAGEGGLVVFGSSERAKRFRAWSNFGFAGTRLSSIVGTNAKMPEVSAAYGLASLDAWERDREEWQVALRTAHRITEELGVASPVDRYSGVHPYWIVQFAHREIRDRAVRVLEAEGVESRLWWPAPLHEMPAFREWAPASAVPQCTHAADTSLGLPMYRDIDAADLDRVGSALAKAVGH